MSTFIHSPTISSTIINSIISRIEQMGIDSFLLKSEIGLDNFNLSDCDLKLNYRYVIDFIKLACAKYKGNDFGLVCGSKFQTLSLGILGHLLVTSSSGIDALQKYECYQQLIGDGIRFDFKDETICQNRGEQLTVTLGIHPEIRDQVDSTLIDLFFAEMVEGLRLLTGDSAPLLQVDFQRSKPKNSDEYQKLFACQVNFSQPNNRALMSKTWLKQPFFTTNPELHVILEQQINTVLNRMRGEDCFSNQVRYHIMKCIDGHKINISRISHCLSLSERTIQRRLQKTEHSFQSLLDEVRANFSMQQLQTNLVSIEELSYLLAFSEPSIYRKTFKKWTGMTPTEYKKSLLNTKETETIADSTMS